jgi:YD repeat-containing protein
MRDDRNLRRNSGADVCQVCEVDLERDESGGPLMIGRRGMIALRKLLRGPLILAIVLGAAISDSVSAAETVTYSYDALGRLVRTQKNGGPASGVDAQVQYDAAGNRTNVTVQGAVSNAPPTRVIVLPLNGYTIIPLGS